VLLKNFRVRGVVGITEEERKRIYDFLQGAVYCWCKNRKNEWFSLRDLMGGDNYYWKGTPLNSLYLKHKNKGKADEEAVNKGAGKDAGWLLKKMIKEDKRMFDTKREDYIRKYKWKE